MPPATETVRGATGVGAAAGGKVFHPQALGAADGVLGRQIGQGDVEAALEVPLLRLEGGATLLVHEGGDRVGEPGVGIVLRGLAPRLHMQAPP